jgi:uncharacterized membrane protein
MQSINVVVLNALFFTFFFGTAVISVILAVFSFFKMGEGGALFLLAGSLLYVIGTFGVTAVCNVPLNNRLAAVTPDGADREKQWRHYVRHWTVWNHIRTLAALGALSSFILALG